MDNFVVRDWASIYAGPIAALIGVAFLLIERVWGLPPQVQEWIGYASLCIAALLIPVAQYRVWRSERKAREEEIAKNAMPELRGRAYRFEQHGFLGHNGESWAEFRFNLEICNYRDVPTSVKGVRMRGAHLTPTTRFERRMRSIEDLRFHERDLLELAPDLLLTRGENHRLSGDGLVIVEGQLQPNFAVPLDDVSVLLVDAFGNEHEIRVSPGEQIRFSM